jgi:hypothetical protein
MLVGSAMRVQVLVNAPQLRNNSTLPRIGTAT